jgi:hypothetical protein
MSSAEPLVSVVIATYHRSNILPYAIESVQRQTVADWELLVVDDASPDDTREVVEAMAAGDDRISYVRLPVNFGDQSGPNNAGQLLAAGRHLAFLNHDDQWLDDHLEIGLASLQATGADLAFATCAMLRATTEEDRAEGRWSFRTQATGARGRYRPGEHVPASGWVFRRDLVRAIGPWRSARDVHATASADWLFRAWRRRRVLVATGEVSVVGVPSVAPSAPGGGRVRTYAERQAAEQELCARLVRRPDARPSVLAALVDELPAPPNANPAQVRNLRLARTARRLRDRAFDRTLALAGVNPLEVRFALRYRSRGRYIRHLRSTRGLDELPPGR